MTPTDRQFLEQFIAWCRLAADRAARSKRPDEATGLLRAAAKLEEGMARGE